MDRKEFNGHIVTRCIELLRSTETVKISEGVILSAYLIEQAFKKTIREANPLLYFEHASLTPERIAHLVSGRLSQNEILELKTVIAKKLVPLMCELKTELKPSLSNFLELFRIRNILVHSTDDIIPAIETSSETAVSALRAAKEYVINCSNIASTDFNPLTSEDFESLQSARRQTREQSIMSTLHAHREIHNHLTPEEIQNRIRDNEPKEDSETWIEQTIECPACHEVSFDEIMSVDVDVSDGETWMTGGSSWLCRVCELELSQYELNLIEGMRGT